MRKIQSKALLEFEINPELIGEGMTQSEMQTWDNCGEKWYLGYNLLLTKLGSFSWALTYGGWIHGALEEFYTTKGKRWSISSDIRNKQFLSQEQLADVEYWSKLAQIQMEIYASHYKNDFDFFRPIPSGIEKIIDIIFEGVRLKGMIDVYAESLANGGYYVIDHKTTGRIDRQIIMGWDFRFQFMFYCWLAWKMWGKEFPIHGYYINAIKKPQLRRGEHESIQTFLQRVQTDMQVEPEKYFYRERLRLKKGDLKHFEKEILRPKIERTKMLLDPKIPPSVKHMLVRNKNTDHCLQYGQPCPYLMACKNGLALEGHAFRIREIKHEELIEAE